MDVAVADFAPDCEYIPSSVHPGAAEVYRGPDAYKRFVGWLLNEFDDPGVEIHELIDAGDQVVAFDDESRPWETKRR